MANKKTTKSKAKSNTKSQAKQSAKGAVKNNDEALRVAGIVIFAFSVIFFCLAVINGDGVWNVLHNVYVGIFGVFAACIFPLITVVVSVFYSFANTDKAKFIAKSVESVVMVLILAAFVHVVRNQPSDDFAEVIKTSYNDAPITFNGGFIGAVLGWLLLSMGKAPAVILSIVLFLVDFMLLTGITVRQFFAGAAKPAKVAYEKAAPVISERRERRRMSKENIDVPLDVEPPAEEVRKPKGKGKKKVEAEPETTSVPKDIIDEINAATARNKRERENKKAPAVKEKTIDEIVEDVSKDDEEKVSKAEKFIVSKEAMENTVSDYKLPPVDLLNIGKKKSVKDSSNMLKENAEMLIETLRSFNVEATITDISCGPTVTRYELKPAAGIRISKITNLADDIALNLAATHVRIEAPIPGKAAVGIEVPNTVKNAVTMRELIDTPEFEKQGSKLSAGLGKGIDGQCVYCDISKMPHLLVAGTTGSGKSVCMNSIIASILYRAKPDEVKFLMIDPKQVEFSKYANIPHLLVPVVTDPRKAAGALGWAVSEMLQRYQRLSQVGVRDIDGYNKYVQKYEDMEPMPKICIFIDEFADLMMAAPKEVEDSVCRLAQMARAVGMHLVIATQRPSVDVITGLIKANISSRIALTVSSQIDSRTILDTAGAEKLLGHGDMLYAPIGATKPIRVQGCFISDEEVEELCNFVKNQGESQYDESIAKEIEAKAVQDKKASPFESEGDGEQLDALFEKAVDVVLESGTASTSFLQRKLSVGYARGAKIIDQLEEKGIIGKANGSKGREIKISRQQWIEMQANASNNEFTADNTEQMTFELVENDNSYNALDDEDNADVISDNQAYYYESPAYRDLKNASMQNSDFPSEDD
ncbi:MAG: DNA translocase FtsK [Clostridium sp.]|nr:DNA translocase FtsK [Clostridium sp.]